MAAFAVTTDANGSGMPGPGMAQMAWRIQVGSALAVSVPPTAPADQVFLAWTRGSNPSSPALVSTVPLDRWLLLLATMDGMDALDRKALSNQADWQDAAPSKVQNTAPEPNSVDPYFATEGKDVDQSSGDE